MRAPFFPCLALALVLASVPCHARPGAFDSGGPDPDGYALTLADDLTFQVADDQAARPTAPAAVVVSAARTDDPLGDQAADPFVFPDVPPTVNVSTGPTDGPAPPSAHPPERGSPAFAFWTFVAFGALALGATVFDYLRSAWGNCQTLIVTAGVGGLAGGALVQVDRQWGFVMQDTAEGTAVAVVVETDNAGIEYRKANVAFVVGDDVYWDADGNPVSGTAGSGAMTNTSAAGANPWMGTAVEVAASGDTLVRLHKKPLPQTT